MDPYGCLILALSCVGFLAARTTALDLGVLVGSVTLHNPALVGKLVATLDVLSQGRARCGLGAGWFEREHRLYGYPFPTATERLDADGAAAVERLFPLIASFSS